MKKHILIIDDDEKLNTLLIDYLGQFDFQITTAVHPKDGLQLISRLSPDLIILDIMLPDMDGFEVCKTIRKTSDIPIIMLTARGEVTDRIVGLEIGADDYLPKPFEPRELVARIQSVLRRNLGQKQTDIRTFGSLTVDLQKQTVILESSAIELTTLEFELLKYFIDHPGRVLNRDAIMDHLRGMDWDAFNRSIDVLISRLRQKLNDDPKKPRWIKTIWGSGYKFIGDSDA